MFLAFGIFIIACGATHAMEVWTLWTPTYWLSGAVKAVTAVASMTTAVLLVKLVPVALRIPRPAELQRAHDDLARVLEQLRAERAADARFRALLEAAPDAMVVVGEDRRIQLVNAQTEKLFGYERADLVGQPLRVLIPDRFASAHDRHEGAFFARPTVRQMGSDLELFGRHKEGADIPIEVSLSPLETEQGMTVSAAIRDVSERRRMEGTAKTLSDRLKSAVDSIQDAFAIFDADDRLVLCNSPYRALFDDSLEGPPVGRTYANLIDTWMNEANVPDSEIRDSFRRERLARKAQGVSTTADVRTRDGRSLRVTDRRTPEGGIVSVVWDLTDDERRAEELREARAAAEAASSAKSEFLSSMSHELRTPLNAILGFAQLLQRDRKEPLSDRHRDRVAQIIAGGSHLLRIIDDILDLSRIEAGGVSISVEPVGLDDVLEEVKRSLAPLAEQQSIRLEVRTPAELPTISADRTRFLQILLNLGSNAIKYNRPGGSVTFTMRTPAPERVRILVRDTGIGIPHDKQAKIFQPFQRAGQEAGPIQGTGIGLVITKRLATLMGGDVDFNSTPGAGSEFWVDIPVHGSATRSSFPPPRTAVVGADSRPADSSLILYVEDNPANVSFMRDLVGTLDGVELITAPTAEVGIAMARAHRPRVVVMDINLPGMSGLAALRVLRESAETRDIPVIALTAAASPRDKATRDRRRFSSVPDETDQGRRVHFRAGRGPDGYGPLRCGRPTELTGSHPIRTPTS
jgi:PAS domain S-box-containing protein